MNPKTLFVLLIPLLLLPTARASTPTAATGSFTTTALDTGLRVTDEGNLVITQVLTVTFAGDFIGALSGEDVVVIDPSTGHGTLRGTGSFSGTLTGVSGTMNLSFSGTVNFPSITLYVTILGGTGGLANLHGQGTVQGILNVGGTYSIQYHFDPGT